MFYVHRTSVNRSISLWIICNSSLFYNDPWIFYWTATLQIEIMLLRFHDIVDKTYGTCPIPWLDEYTEASNLNAFLHYIYICFLKILMNISLKSTFHEREMQSFACSQKVNIKWERTYLVKSILKNVSRISLILFAQLLVEEVKSFHVNIIERWYPVFLKCRHSAYCTLIQLLRWSNILL